MLPAEGESQAGETTALTVIPLAGDKIFYYHGALHNALQQGSFGTTSYSLTEGIGQVIRNKQAAMENIKPGYKKDLMLMIKPANDSNCGNMVDILDEVQINQVVHYAIMDLEKEEKKAIADKTGTAL